MGKSSGLGYYETHQSDFIYTDMNIESCRKIGLIIKPNDERGIPLAKRLITYLLTHFDQVIINQQIDTLTKIDHVSYIPHAEFAENCDLVIALGGDGTLLSAARLLARKQIPLMGIHFGTLGFLVEIAPEDMETQLDEIFSGKYRIEQRLMLEAAVMRDDQLLAQHDACNDVVIRHPGSARMIEMDTTVDGAFINTVWADGLIVATPTGSTAYALSSGGPLVEPTLDATLIVPICPHTLSYRPLIIDAHKTVEIIYTLHNQDSGLVSMDGQIAETIQPGDRIIIKAMSSKLKLIQPRTHDYFSTLRTKLRWSEKL